mgnify:CR=1 FL=1|jgi:hypothetical protein|tara:strand:- start:8760 stop:9218 length:459 start_codon:yes stop_codon:yes gene_type:complete
MKINKPTPSYAESNMRITSQPEDRCCLIYSYFKIIDAQKYPYKNLREVEFYNKHKKCLGGYFVEEDFLLSIPEFQELLDYYIYMVRNVDFERIGEVFYWSFISSLVRHFKIFVINKKKPWSKKDVANEVFIIHSLTAKEWVVNRNRNEGRYY